MSYMHRRKLHPEELRGVLIFAAVLIAIALFLVFDAKAEAASLRICYDGIDPVATKISAYVDTAPLYDDVLANSTASGTTGKRCSDNAVPATLVRGRDLSITLRAFNAFGEGSPASAPVTFRAPTTPAAPTNVSVSIIAP